MIIACDTSSVICSVAISHQGAILFEREAEGGQIHIEKLSPFLKEALVFCESQPVALDALAIAIGPGSFNGLRIGLATMKGLAVSRGLPLIPVPTTDAMAYGNNSALKGLARAIIFSHRNFVHFADYSPSSSDTIQTPEFHYDTWDKLASNNIDQYFGKVDRGFKDWLNSEEGSVIKTKFLDVNASATHVAQLAESRMDQGIEALDDLEPLYNAHYAAKKWVAPKF